MIEDPTWAESAPSELIDRLARKFIDRYRGEARGEIVSVIEALVEDGNLGMARLWTKILHASERITEVGNDRFSLPG